LEANCDVIRQELSQITEVRMAAAASNTCVTYFFNTNIYV